MPDEKILSRVSAYLTTARGVPSKGKKPPLKVKKPPAKAPAKRLSRKQLEAWQEKSYNEQVQYLEEHPDSPLQKVGVTKRKTRGKKKQEEAPAEDAAPQDQETPSDENSAEEPEAEAPKEKKPRGPGLQKMARKMGVRLSLDESESNINLKYVGNNSGEKGNGGKVVEQVIKQAHEDGKSVTLDPRTNQGRAYFSKLGFKDDPNNPGNMVAHPPKPESEEKTEEPPADDNIGDKKPEGTDAGEHDPNIATPHQPLDDEAKAEAEDNLKDLSREGELEPGSQSREGAAATLEETGNRTLRDQLSPEDRELIAKEWLAQRRQPKKKWGTPSGRKLAAFAGMAAVAGLAGVAMFAVSPILGLYFGQAMLDHFGTISSAVMNVMDQNEDPDYTPSDYTPSTAAADDGMSAFVEDVADYLRNGELPEDVLEAVRLGVGLHEK